MDVISIHALLAESDRKLLYPGATRKIYFYPRSPCGERRARLLACSLGVFISIHALLAESDGAGHTSQQPAIYFYPRSPCGERQEQWRHPLLLHTFLSTLSLRRATLIILLSMSMMPYFYPRSPCGERRGPQNTKMPSGSFLSTLSLRRATPLR